MTPEASFYSHHHFHLIQTLSTILLLTIVRTRNQLENMLKDQLVDKVRSLVNFKNEINSKFSELNDHFNDFDATCKMGNSNLSV